MDEVVCHFQDGWAKRTAAFHRHEDLFAQQGVTGLHPRVGEQPAEEFHPRGRVTAPDERRGWCRHAAEAAETVELGGTEAAAGCLAPGHHPDIAALAEADGGDPAGQLSSLSRANRRETWHQDRVQAMADNLGNGDVGVGGVGEERRHRES
jgi:hypothetical protein